MLDPIRRFGARRAVTVVLAVGLVAAVAVPAISAAQSSGPPSTAAAGATIAGTSTAGELANDAPSAADLGLGSSDAAPAALRARIAALGRVLRGDLTVLRPDGTTMVIHEERGRITAVSASSITVKGADGVSATFAVTADTKVRVRLRAATIGDLKVGDRATIFGTKDGAAYTAKLIRCVRPIPAGGATGSGG